MSSKAVVGLSVIIILLGLGVGYLLSSSSNSASVSASKVSDTAGSKMVSSEKEIGSTDTKAFPDTATGILETGGLGNEGTHKLIREGGPSQTVYLISSVVDLNEFVGKKVEIWGQSIKASKAPWLMDVGRVKLNE